MKKLLLSFIIAALVSCNSSRISSGTYEVIEVRTKPGQCIAMLKGCKKFLFFPTDTLKPGDRVQIVSVGRVR